MEKQNELVEIKTKTVNIYTPETLVDCNKLNCFECIYEKIIHKDEGGIYDPCPTRALLMKSPRCFLR